MASWMNRWKQHLAMAMLLCAAGPASAVVSTFNGHGDGVDWADADNWDTGVVPGAGGNWADIPGGFDVVVDSDATVGDNPASPNSANLLVGSSAGVASLTINAGSSLTVETGGNTSIGSGNGALATLFVMGDLLATGVGNPDDLGRLIIGGTGASNGTLEVTGNAHVTAASIDVASGVNSVGVLNFASAGTLTLSRVNNNQGSDFAVGQSASAHGIVNVTGAGTIAMNYVLAVGFDGKGTWNQSAGTLQVGDGDANDDHLIIGQDANGVGDMTITGGVVNVSGNFILGQHVDAKGEFNLHGGSVAVGRDVLVGNNDNTNENVFNVVGSDANFTAARHYTQGGDGVLSMTLDAGGVTAINLTGTDSQATVAGVLSLHALTDPGTGDILLIENANSDNAILGTFNSVLANGVYAGLDDTQIILQGDDSSFRYAYTLQYDYDWNGTGNTGTGNDLVLAFVGDVPEPASAMLVAGALMLMPWRRRK